MACRGACVWGGCDAGVSEAPIVAAYEYVRVSRCDLLYGGLPQSQGHPASYLLSRVA